MNQGMEAGLLRVDWSNIFEGGTTFLLNVRLKTVLKLFLCQYYLSYLCTTEFLLKYQTQV